MLRVAEIDFEPGEEGLRGARGVGCLANVCASTLNASLNPSGATSTCSGDIVRRTRRAWIASAA